MAVIGINPVNPKQEKSALEKIAMGLDIANGLLGVTLAVPKFLQERKTAKFNQEQAQADRKLADERALEQQVNTDVALASKTRPAKPGETDVINTPRMGSRVIRPETAADLSEFEKKTLDAYSKDYIIVPPEKASKDDIKVSFGGHETYFRSKPEDASKALDMSANRRKEFLGQSQGYQIQADAFAKIKSQEEAAVSQKAPAQVSMMYAYIKMLDPNSVVREGEMALASQAKGVPETVLNTYNRIVQGAKLSPEQVREFMSAANNIYSSALLQHQKRERFYKGLARREGLDEGSVVPDLTPDFGAEVNAPTADDIKKEMQKRNLLPK